MQDFAFIIPEYAKGVGQITKVRYEDGAEKDFDISLRGYMSKLYREYAIDKLSLKRKYGGIVGNKNCVPLPISPKLLLIPLKIRKPLLKGDGALGYFNYHSIEDFKYIESTITEIYFNEGFSYKVFCSKKTVIKHINDALIISQYYKKDMGISDEQTLSAIYSDLKKPATKEDIAILAKEVISLKNCFNQGRNRV